MTIQSDNDFWDSNEMNVLRKVFKQCKRENLKLKAEASMSDERWGTMGHENSKLKSEIQKLKDDLQDAKKANERLYILSNNLEGNLKKVEARNSLLAEELHHKRDELSLRSKETHTLKIKHDKERLTSNTYHQKLVDDKLISTRENEHREHMLIITHKDQIEKMQSTIDSLVQDREKESKVHDHHIMALEHLRKHFTDLDVAHYNTQEKLTKWTY